MPSFDDRTLGDQSGRNPAARMRLRARPRLEVLETRCLMSSWHPRTEHYSILPLSVHGPAATTQLGASHGLDRDNVRQPMTQQAGQSARVWSGDNSGPGYGSWG